MPGIDARSDAIYELVEEGSAVERAATGFTFTEGPLWHPTEHHLLFSDMPADIRRKYTPDGTVTEVMNPSNKCNGMTYDDVLNRLVCEHVTSCLVREFPDGTRETVASHFEGQELNSPNDVTVRSDGSIYFSDPWYGRMPVVGLERERELGFQGVYRIAPGGGEPLLVVDREDYEQPNGLCFSPDEYLLYVNDTPGAFIDVYDVNEDGSLSNRRGFFKNIGTGVIEEGIPDGMKCDERGNIWVTGPDGIWVISAAGEHLGVIEVPENTGNLTWGGLAHTVHRLVHVAVHNPHHRRPAPRAVHAPEGHAVNDERKLHRERCGPNRRGTAAEIRRGERDMLLSHSVTTATDE